MFILGLVRFLFYSYEYLFHDEQHPKKEVNTNILWQYKMVFMRVLVEQRSGYPQRWKRKCWTIFPTIFFSSYSLSLNLIASYFYSFPLYHLETLFFRFNDTFFSFHMNAIPFSIQSFKHASVLKVSNLRTVFVYTLSMTWVRLQSSRRKKRKDKSRSYKWWLFLPEKK